MDYLAQAEKYARDGQYADAVKSAQKALETAPSFRARLALGRYQYHTGQFEVAVQSVREAERHDPLMAEFGLVQRAMQSRDLANAHQLSLAMLAKAPGHPRAVFALAEIHGARGDIGERIAVLKEGLSHSPANLILRHMLIGTLEDNADIEEALTTSRKIVEIQPSFDSLWIHMGICLRYGLNQEALDAADRAEQFCGADKAKQSEVDLIRGQVYKITGRREDSIRALRQCINNKPENATAWSALADMKNFSFSKEEQGALSKIINAPQGDPLQKSMAGFALGKALELEGDLPGAMPFYAKANGMMPGIRFDARGYNMAVEKVMAGFGQQALNTQGRVQKPTPIFIVGMPRSGSTLIEQILASHSQIEGTIELPILPRIKRQIQTYCAKTFRTHFLASLGRLSEDELRSFGRAYIDKTDMFREEGRSFFTDKLPPNFENTGLIHKILPNAIIIDARRNPLDCGLSIYKQFFAAGSHYAYDLSHIGAYYKGYLKLMDHWDAVLPGKVYRVQYEDMIDDPEAQVRGLLDHIGLDFEEACLRFYENKRAVRTASSEQVRQPINRKGIGVWRQVEAALEPLKQALGAETLARFERELAL